MIEPTRRFQVLKLFRKQDKLFRTAISQRIFSGCNVAFGDQNQQFFRSFGNVSDAQTNKGIELANSAKAMLQTRKNYQQCEDGSWMWVDAAQQLFAVFLPEPGADHAAEEVWKKFLTQIEHRFSRIKSV